MSEYSMWVCDHCQKEHAVHIPRWTVEKPNYQYAMVPDCGPPSYTYDYCNLNCLLAAWESVREKAGDVS